MAFGFIKKVFSFGKKEAEVEQPEATNAEVSAAEAVPEFLTREIEANLPDAPAPDETPATPPTPPEAPQPAPEEAPQPAPDEQPLPVEPERPEPAPVEVPAETPEPAKPAESPAPAEIPQPAPAEVPAEKPVEQPAPVELPVPEPAAPEPAPLEVPDVQPSPVEADVLPPVLAELKAEAAAKLEDAVADGVSHEGHGAEAPVVDVVRDTAESVTPAAAFSDGDAADAHEGDEVQAVLTSSSEALVEESGAALPDSLPPRGEGAYAAPIEPDGSHPLQPLPGKVTVQKIVEQKAESAPVIVPETPRPSWFQRLREGLSRSSRELSGSIAGIFTKRKLDEETLQDLEDVLIRADLGVETALRITDTLASSRYGKDVSDVEVRTVMAEQIEKVLGPVAIPLELDLSHKPHVILVVGVNGTGKTTTIGKLAAKLTAGGLSVMLAAGDTFRAAAIEQLRIWGERTKSPVIATKLGADAAGLAYDAFVQAREAGSDVLIIDTAGRLQNKAELMAELEKVVRVLGKLDPEAPHTVLQTVDATTGQNALNQVEIFRNVAGVNGLVMTKLDGTARGGILVAIAAKHRLPVYFIGVGEQIDDLEPFSARDFAKAIAGVA